MGKDIFPTTIAGFTEYIKNAYTLAQTKLPVYGIGPEKLLVVTPFYNTFIEKEAMSRRQCRNDYYRIIESTAK
jgi:hypothetical protein